MHQNKCELKSTLLDYRTHKIVYVGCIFKIFAPLRQRIALLGSAKLIFVLIKFTVSEYDSFRFSLSFSASFWIVFVEPCAAPPVHAKIIVPVSHNWKFDLCASRSYLEV